MSHISDFTYHKCTTLLSLPMWLSTCYHFPSYQALYLFHYFPSACVNSFIQSCSPGPFSLATGSLRRKVWHSELSMPQSHFNLCPGNQNPFKPLQAEATWDQKVHYFIQWTTLYSAKATSFKSHHFRVGENEFSDYKDFIYFNENIINMLSLSNFLLYLFKFWMNNKSSNLFQIV